MIRPFLVLTCSFRVFSWPIGGDFHGGAGWGAALDQKKRRPGDARAADGAGDVIETVDHVARVDPVELVALVIARRAMRRSS